MLIYRTRQEVEIFWEGKENFMSQIFKCPLITLKKCVFTYHQDREEEIANV